MQWIKAKNYKWNIWYFIRVPLFISVVFYLGLVIVYCIPTSAMKENVLESCEILTKEGLYYQSYADGHTYDNATVTCMIKEAINTGPNPFVAAITNEYFVCDLKDALTGQGNIRSYFRYWHGYLVFLKPMLCFLNLYQIRLVCGTLTIALLMWTGNCLKDKLGRHGIYTSLALALSWGLYSGMNAAITLPIFSSFVISLAGSIFVIKYLKLERNDIKKVFFIIGAVTVYFDFLDNPILTLGIPLCMLSMRMYYDSVGARSATLAKTGLLSGMFWGLGYIFLWTLKWVLALITIGPTAYEDISEQIEFRLGIGEKASEYPSTPFSAICKNLYENGVFRVKIIVGIAITCAILMIVFLIKRRYLLKKRYSNLIQALAVIATTGILPFMWYAVLNNHSVIHAEFISWRNLMLTMFAALLLLYNLLYELCGNASFQNN